MAAREHGTGIAQDRSPASPSAGEDRATAEDLRALELLMGACEARDGGRIQELVQRDGWARLSRRSAAELADASGHSLESCERLAAGFALGRRVEAARWTPRGPLRDPAGVYRYLWPRLRGLEREQFHVLLLDGKHRLRHVRLVSEGTLTTSLVHPREVFRDAVREAAAAVMVAHNHPSGDPEPSREDLEVTERLARAGRLLGIPLLDHLVVAEGGYTSLRERGWVR